MEFNWDDFKNKYNNEQEARQGFAALCETIMQKQYPDFAVKNSDIILEDENTEDKSLDRKCIIFLPKYFLDGVSNSRKGQIRKSLNDNLPYMKANKIKQWFLMMPLEFSPEEKNWWENWSLRIKQENDITPTAILSGQIIDLVAKHGIEFKGLESVAKQKSEDDTVDFVFDDEPEQSPVQDADSTTTTTTTTTTITTVTTEQPADPSEEPAQTVTQIVEEPAVENAPEPDNQLIKAAIAKSKMLAATASPNETKTVTITVTEETTTEPAQEEPVEQETPQQEPAQEEVKEKEEEKAKEAEPTPKRVAEPNLNQLKLTYRFKQNFEELENQKKNLPTTGKSNGQRGIFDRRRDDSNVKNYLNDFVFGDLSNFKGKELVKKAQIYVTNEQYSRGLYIYEYAYAKKLIDPEIRDEYKKGVAEADFKLRYKYQMILGDLLFAKGDYINAAEAYEKAVNTKNDFTDKLEESMSYTMESSTYSPSIRDNEADYKWLEAKGEALLHINEYADAATNFQRALDLDPDNNDLAERLALSKKLQRWSSIYKNKWFGWLSPLWAPFHYLSIRNNEEVQGLEITETIHKRAKIGIIVWILLLVLAAAIFYFKDKISLSPSSNVTTQAEAPSTPLELCLTKGDYYMSLFSQDNPHFIDSAINAYNRAIRIDNTDNRAQTGYNRAMIVRSNFIAQIQQNITNDSATYFLSMRRPTEGLRLFKYKYDPTDTTKRKFGFVDTLGNIVIPPFYDFNYKTMNEQGETFYNGRAKVCLKVGDNDTLYFYIDKRGNRIDE